VCFSAEADLAAGLVVGIVAIDALRHVSNRRQLPLAAIPLYFSVHELDETVVWLGLQGRVPWRIGREAVWVFLVMAFLLPLLVPVVVTALETVAWRRILMSPLIAAGGVVAGVTVSTIVRGPIGAAVAGHHIVYRTSQAFATVLGVVYVVTTCGSPLLSSHRTIVAYGVCNLAAVGVLAWLTLDGLTSLWCLWAAITSIGIAAYLRHREHLAGRPLTLTA
jgi:hypothetical protein